METIYKKRLIARVTVEAKTPLAIGTGIKNIVTDAPVITDINGLPFIPGTAIAGILRHALKIPTDARNSIFGFQDRKEKKDRDKGHGSNVIFTDAVMIGADGKPIDGLKRAEDLKGDFYEKFLEMPIRQHVRINDKGVTANTGKFDNQVVYKGTRFLFEMELYYDHDDYKDQFEDALRQLRNSALRIGSGTRNGYGELDVVECKTKDLNLEELEDLDIYLNKSSRLDVEMPDMDDFKEKASSSGWASYTLYLNPESFFLFGSGHGDDEADMTPVDEFVIKWDDSKPQKPSFSKKGKTLIPASSVKGALAHRTAYHWNKLNKHFVENGEAKTGEANPAVAAIFGTAENKITRGNILLSDIIEDTAPTKILNHVAIDRFTGGAMDGALFAEKASYGKGREYVLNIKVNNQAFESDDSIKPAFEQALDDICKGLLPLGGGVNRGNGIFTGIRKSDYE